MREFWSMTYSGCVSFFNWYWGGVGSLLSALIVFVLIAHITDIMCAIVNRRPFGRTVAQGVLKRILIFVLVGIGNVLDENVLASTPVLRVIVILYYLSVEGLNIMESVANLGLPVPEQLKDVLKRLREK